MGRRAFVVVADWPYYQLSNSGKATACCTGDAENHLGIFIPCTNDDEIVAHSEPKLSHPSARNAKHVSFDYMIDLRPRFQSFKNADYFTKEVKVRLYPILGVDAEAIHSACVEVAREAPKNHFCYRFNYVCWCWPFACWFSGSERIGASTCVALTMRIIARAKSMRLAPYTSDAATFVALDMNSFSLPWNSCQPATLTGYSPRMAIKALQKVRVLSRPVNSFEDAISQCKKDSMGYPFLPLPKLMSRV